MQRHNAPFGAVSSRVLAVVALLSACGEGSPSTDVNVDDLFGVHRRSCGELDLTACERAPACEVRRGVLVDEARGCLGGEVAVGCSRRVDRCPTAIGYARDALGRAFMFPNLCLPDGLEVLSEDDIPGVEAFASCAGAPVDASTAAPCGERSAAECEASPACQGIHGVRFDDKQRCRAHTTTLVGCMEQDVSCPPEVVYVESTESGHSFEVASGCIPAGFEVRERPDGMDAFAPCDET